MDRPVEVIGVPTDFGANRRGVDMGPSAIRYAGLTEAIAAAGVECIDGGDIEVPPLDRWTGEAGEDAPPLKAARRVSSRVSERVREALDAGRSPLVLGGDHSIAIGSLTGAGADGNVGVLWLDAHADFNTPETSPSGNIHGMPLAAVTGQGTFREQSWTQMPGIAADRVSLVGIRDVDPGEGQLLGASDVSAFPMPAIDRDGIATTCEAAIERALGDIDTLHVSLDLDFLDPLEAPGVGTPVPGGVTYREAHYTLERIAEVVAHHSIALSVDVVEVNPIRDQANKTAALATELAASAFGQRIF